MSDADFDAVAFWKECTRDLAAARAQVTRLRTERENYHLALRRIAGHLRIPAMRRACDELTRIARH